VIYEAHVRGMTQFKSMVRELQAANIEVILDVVYNHTGEGNHLGPTLSMRGVDNPAYYRLVESDLRYYMDYTGTGSSCPATATGRNGPLYWTPLPSSYRAAAVRPPPATPKSLSPAGRW
jgi:pullulanase/glycogen debranching enzyme